MDSFNFSIDNSSSFFDIPYELELDDCVNNESMQTMAQFLKCLKYFLSKSVLISCIVLSFSFCTFVLNIVVIIFINKLKTHKTVFDKIFIGHSLVDALVGILVIPNYCIYSVFGYWPLGKYLCHFYVSLDYTICHVGILHMVFIAYARLRSLQAPKKYHKEFLIYNAELTMLGLWTISGLLWLPAVNVIINLTFKNNECYFNFNPVYIIIQDSVAYLLPMSIILLITFYILKILHNRNKQRKLLKRKKIVKKTRKSHMKFPQNKQQNQEQAKSNTENLTTSEFSIVSDVTSNHLNENESQNESFVESNSKKDIKRKKSERCVSLLKNNLNNHDSPACLIKIASNFKTNPVPIKIFNTRKKLKLNAYTKLYVIIITFCLLWLPFCILWPVFSVCQSCISGLVYQVSYWMGYAQSLINPILLLILNPNYKK